MTGLFLSVEWPLGVYRAHEHTRPLFQRGTPYR